MHRHPECRYREELDMATLVWTRGKGFPLSRLESRLRCPQCGSRDVVLLITIPRETQTARAQRRGCAGDQAELVGPLRSTPDKLHRPLVIAEIEIALGRRRAAAFDLGAQRQHVLEACEVELGVGREAERGIHQ
jgi:hypothetical protein